MNVTQGDKVTITIANGTRFPGIVIADQTAEYKTIFPNGEAIEINITRADVITLRTPLTGEPYLALTNETVQYGYRPIMGPRFNSIVGLDADSDGAKLSLATLVELQGNAYSAWQALQFEARKGVTLDADL